MYIIMLHVYYYGILGEGRDPSALPPQYATLYSRYGASVVAMVVWSIQTVSSYMHIKVRLQASFTCCIDFRIGTNSLSLISLLLLIILPMIVRRQFDHIPS